mgnify:CR=1 FL=1
MHDLDTRTAHLDDLLFTEGLVGCRQHGANGLVSLITPDSCNDLFTMSLELLKGIFVGDDMGALFFPIGRPAHGVALPILPDDVFHRLLGDLADLRQRHDLEPAAVGQDWPVPANELVQAS